MTHNEQGCHIVISDDSVITAKWWDAGDGGTAPHIEAVCRFRSQGGAIVEERRSLLSIVHNGEEYSHHEIEKIVTYEGEYGQKTYLFFLRAKTESNEYAHDIAAFYIQGDSLCPAEIFNVKESNSSNASLWY